MRVNKFFQSLTQDSKLRPVLIRGTVVSTLKSYYKFLTTMYLPEEEVLYPPETGWPNINQERFAHLGKTDDVIEILRHIPYVRRERHWRDVSHIYDGTIAVDFRADKVYFDSPIPQVALLPAHAIMLATPPESDGQYIFLDTDRATFTLYGAPSGHSGWGDSRRFIQVFLRCQNSVCFSLTRYSVCLGIPIRSGRQNAAVRPIIYQIFFPISRKSFANSSL